MEELDFLSYHSKLEENIPCALYIKNSVIKIVLIYFLLKMIMNIDVVNKEYERIINDQISVVETVNKYKSKLKEFHNYQEAAEKSVGDQRKSLTAMKGLIKKSGLEESEKKERLKKIGEFEKVAKPWRTLFPSSGSFFLRFFIGNADVRMLKPNQRQKYKMVFL
jgi:hypothetical protein